VESSGSINKTTLLAQGSTADIYAWKERKVLKLFREHTPWHANEVAATKTAYNFGLPVPEVFRGREIRMIILAALVGGLAPFCSCEVIPFIAGLLALGTPLAPIMAFWLSSPLIDPPTLLITAGALGWKFAVSKALFAVGIGMFGGFAVKLIAWKA
jgi:hypothetical protein